jgi:hypothetical protein
MPPGRVVTFGLSRDGQPMTVKVQLADKKKEFAMNGHDMKNFHFEVPEIHIPDIDIPSINMVMVTSSARSGLMVENITPQLGEFFGVKNGNGVLVRSVEKGSRAEKAGFRAGDVIVKVNGEPVHDTSDFMHAVRSRNGAAVNVGLIRDKKEQNLNLPLPSKKESGELQQEESLEEPIIDAESGVELSELQGEIARLQPQMELATEDSSTAVVELRKDLCSERKKVHLHSAAKLKNQAQLRQEQLKRNQERLKMRLEQVRQERRAHSFDI